MVNLEKDLIELLDSEKQKFGIPGYDCSVFHQGREIFRHSSGYRDLESNSPITRDTLYQVFSNTKVIVCAAALQLYERGKYLLEDPISDFFPELGKMKVKTSEGLKDAERQITIRDLFCMTSGLGNIVIDDEMGKRIAMEHGGVLLASDLPKYFAEVVLDFEPGTGYYYGLSHELLAALIEKITGEQFSEYLQKHIFEPLGMENTGFYRERLKSKEASTLYGYNGVGQGLRIYDLDKHVIPPMLKECASGGLITTVDDYMRFQESLCRDEVILRRTTVNLMRQNHLSADILNNYGYTAMGMGYGLGVRTTLDMAKSGAPIGFGPFGWSGAAGTYGSIDPENQLTIFYAQHVLDMNMDRTHKLIRNVVYSAVNGV